MSDLGIEIIQKTDLQQRQIKILSDWVERMIELGATDRNFKAGEVIARRMLIMKKVGQVSAEKLAFKDELTDLPNRRAFDEKIVELNRQNRQYSLLLIDIDNFKAINDTYGHDVGDEVLVFTANNLLTNTRQIRESADYVYRWGGEEFAVILQDVQNPTDLLATSDKLRQAVKHAAPVLKDGSGKAINLTVSCGGKVKQITETYADFFRQVDQNLYTAKQQGKDRCIVS